MDQIPAERLLPSHETWERENPSVSQLFRAFIGSEHTLESSRLATQKIGLLPEALIQISISRLLRHFFESDYDKFRIRTLFN